MLYICGSCTLYIYLGTYFHIFHGAYRNFLSADAFAQVVTRDHNLAGYVDIDPLVNPTSQLFVMNPDIVQAWVSQHACGESGGIDKYTCLLTERLRFMYISVIYNSNLLHGYIRAGYAGTFDNSNLVNCGVGLRYI